MIYLTNALPSSYLGGLMVVSTAWPIDELLDEVRAIAKVAESAIGHPSTAELLGVKLNRRSIEPNDGDIVVAVRLVSRSTTPGDVTVRPSDLLVQAALYRLVLEKCKDVSCLGDYLTNRIRVLFGGPEVIRALAAGAMTPRCISDVRSGSCPSCGYVLDPTGKCLVCWPE
jgi:hypothetical protein